MNAVSQSQERSQRQQSATTSWMVVLPYPPSENAYRSTRAIFSKKRGKTIALMHETHEAKQYKAAVAWTMGTLRRSFPVFPDGDLEVDVRIYRPRKTGDVTNRIKVLEDALKGWAWTDDRQVRRFAIERSDADPKRPRAEVHVTWVGG